LISVDASSDEQLLIDAAREFARSELLEQDRRWDRGDGNVVEVLPVLAEMGFFNLVLPESCGGLGCTYRTYAAIIHEISYASPSAAVTLLVQNMAGHVLGLFAPPHLRDSLLPHWGQPENLAAFAISEAAAGSDPSASRTRAERRGDVYVLNGEKMWITNGLTGRWFVTLARTSPGTSKKGLSVMLVDGNATGLGRDPIHGKMGIRGSETAVISFCDVEVPCENLLGQEGEGLAVGLTALNGGRIGIAAQATGIAAACVDEMIKFAHEREQFGTKIAHFDAIQAMVADSAVELAASRELIEFAAARVDRGALDPAASSQAKLFATEAANRIAYRAVQLHGAMGYVQECRVEQLYRDVRVTTIYEGTSEIQRLIIARALLKSGVHS
jgi:hypothetical protein